MTGPHAILTGLAGVAALWIILGVACHNFNPKALVCGADNTLSTSKLQLLIWTVVIVFSYLVMFSFHAGMEQFVDLGLPSNVLIAVGISTATAVAAKAVAVTNAANPALPLVPPLLPAAPSQAGIFQEDDGSPDLGKIQLMIWTLVAVCIYLVKIHYQLHIGKRAMPDIDQTLMVLMGLGHGAYLGKKIATGGGS